MRRRHRAELPKLAHHFNVKPWELELLTFGEINDFFEQAGQAPPIGVRLTVLLMNQETDGGDD